MRTDKKTLKARWLDESFLKEQKALIDLLLKIDAGKLIENTDMRGTTLSDYSYPVEALAKAYLHNVKMIDCDLQSATIGSYITDSEVKCTDFTEVKFKQASFIKSHFIECNFTKSTINAHFTDAVFEKCDFTNAYFTGGSNFSGLGGVRVKFIGCNFANTVFKSLPLRAVRFVNCTFLSTQFINTDLRGAKATSSIGVDSIQYDRVDANLGKDNYVREE